MKIITKTAIFVFLLSFQITECFAEKVVTSDKLEINKAGFISLKGEDTPFTGVERAVRQNGQVEMETHYENGGLNGLMTYYWDNGQKKKESNYKNGNPDGLQTNWYKNGQKSLEELFDNGRRIPKSFHQWDENGKQIR